MYSIFNIITNIKTSLYKRKNYQIVSMEITYKFDDETLRNTNNN